MTSYLFLFIFLFFSFTFSLADNKCQQAFMLVGTVLFCNFFFLYCLYVMFCEAVYIICRKKYMWRYVLWKQPVFPIFTSFWLIEMAILSKLRKPDNFESHSSPKLALPIFEVFIQTSLNVSLSLNQTLLIFLVYAIQTWMNQLNMAISL